jgi:hypothetical protein
MENTPSQTKKRDLKPYLLGAALSYVFCLVYGGRKFVAGADWDFGVAAIGALCFWPVFAFLYLALQTVLRFALRLTWKQGVRYDWLALNLPAVFLILLVGVAALKEPKAAFRHLLANPIPNSVEIKQFARWQGIGEPMRLRLTFEIQQNDLQNLLRSGGYARTNDIADEDHPFAVWLRNHVGPGMKLGGSGPILHYISTNDLRRSLYFCTNRPDTTAYFLYGPTNH